MEKLKDWKCRDCGTILGFLDHEATELRIKIRDLYVWIQGGSVTITCRKCGSLNQLSQTHPSLSTLDEIEKSKKGVE